MATHFIPPDFPGFEESGGAEGFGLDFLANPKGDPELAARYLREAGFESGQVRGRRGARSMVAATTRPGKDTAVVVREQFTASSASR